MTNSCRNLLRIKLYYCFDEKTLFHLEKHKKMEAPRAFSIVDESNLLWGKHIFRIR